MKNTRLTSILGSSLIACALTIGTLASTQSALAQSSTMAEVNIPFSFQMGSQTLPAGSYRILRESGYLVRLQGSDKAGGYVQMHDAIKLHAANNGSVVFDRYGNKYFLRQIWTAGSTNGLECPKSRAEKETLQAKNTQSPSSTELAFNSIPQH